VTSAKRNSLASVNFELCTKVLCVVFGDWETSKGYVLSSMGVSKGYVLSSMRGTSECYVLSLMLSIEGLCVVFDGGESCIVQRGTM
jgi:hypothetical protein